MTRGLLDDRKRRIGVFAYNFPHKKTQDFLLKLFVRGIKVSTILAADPVQLKLPPSLRTKIRHTALDHPREIAERIGASYHVVDHNSAASRDIIRQNKLELGLIAGARILKADTINAFPLGVINFHPGDIPAVRGLNALLRSIHSDIPLCVTAHLIDSRVDAGSLLLKQLIAIYDDDSLLDLSHRLYETQLDLLLPAIEAAISGNAIAFENYAAPGPQMSLAMQQQAIDDAADYVRRHLRETPLLVRPTSPLPCHAG